MKNAFLICLGMLFGQMANASCESERQALLICQNSTIECNRDSDCGGDKVCRLNRCESAPIVRNPDYSCTNCVKSNQDGCRSSYYVITTWGPGEGNTTSMRHCFDAQHEEASERECESARRRNSKCN